MDNIVTRKCAKCKGEIKINKNRITGVIQFQGKYYHYDCFEHMATQKTSSKRGKPKMWQEALDNIWTIEDKTKQLLTHIIAKDDLNTWLLDHYDISVVPTRFWQIIADLEMGKYKGKKCKPISTKSLYDCWQWGQINLNKIAVNNKMNHQGPHNDVDRLRYDLAILITKYPSFLKHKSKMAVIESANSFKQEQPTIDYSSLSNNNNTSCDNDILDLIDEIF